MVVQAVCIEMRRNDGRILAVQKSFRQLQPDPVRQLRRQFPLGKALHQMIALHAVHLAPPFLVGPHIPICRLQGTADGALEYAAFCFFPVAGIVHGFLQG